MPKIIFVLESGEKIEVEACVGETLLQVVHRHGIELESACEGNLRCGRCHVTIPFEWWSEIEPPREDERALLDRLIEYTPDSRLGCQVTITAQSEGMHVYIPSQAPRPRKKISAPHTR